MIPIEIVNDNYVIRNICLEDLEKALDCINQSEENCKILGNEEYISYNYIMERYLETLTNSLEFFCGVFIDEKLIGIIKGRIENNMQKEIWIMSFIIMEEYRNKGLGTNILKSFEDYFLKSYYIKIFCAIVFDDNISGISFWVKNGYIKSRIIKGMVTNNKNIIIYKKDVEQK
ncbi:GNAT family N-acetyltransferase [Caloramator sp. E03]|uniref:GNAT family N-acetyltransferase n=1 Tax=Caloramator sp. E03 TaxID=2576307 RepID=UPI00143D2B8B|nr:GNAT family N-acetyltransferase [Caloramator sp. E03]